MKINELHFYEERQADGDTMFRAYYGGYRITVLNRMTGFGCGQRDIETGLKDYRLDPANDFWLASGMFDIRQFGDLTIEQAIEKIKENANTVVPGGE